MGLFVFALLCLFSTPCLSQLPPACSSSINTLLNATIVLGEVAYNVSYHCPGALCNGDVQLLTQSVTKVMISLRQLLSACGVGISQACGKRLDYVSQDLGQVAQDAAAVAQACASGGGNQTACASASAELAGDISRAITDIVTSITICSMGGVGQQDPSLVSSKKRK